MKLLTIVILALIFFSSSSGVQDQKLNSQFRNVKMGSIISNDSLPEWAAKLKLFGHIRVAVPAPKEERYAHLSWPKAVCAIDGTIILAYEAGIFHGSHGGNSPAVSLSHDNGKTFSPPHILKSFSPIDEYTASGNLVLGIAEDGSVILLAMAYRGNEANNIFGWRSNDRGKSWEVVNTSKLGPNKTGSVCGSIVQLPEGKLMVMGHYRKPSKPFDTGIWQSVSIDNGQTWGSPKMVTNINGGEPVLVRTDDRLLVFIRGRGPGSVRQYIAVSDDFGETWQTELSNITAQNEYTRGLAHPFAMVNPNKRDEIMAITVERPLPGSAWLWCGNAQNLDFKIDRKLLEFPKIEGNKNTDYGYNWMIHVGENRFLMFYYHGLSKGANAIWVSEFTL